MSALIELLQHPVFEKAPFPSSGELLASARCDYGKHPAIRTRGPHHSPVEALKLLCRDLVGADLVPEEVLELYSACLVKVGSAIALLERKSASLRVWHYRSAAISGLPLPAVAQAVHAWLCPQVSEATLIEDPAVGWRVCCEGAAKPVRPRNPPSGAKASHSYSFAGGEGQFLFFGEYSISIVQAGTRVRAEVSQSGGTHVARWRQQMLELVEQRLADCEPEDRHALRIQRGRLLSAIKTAEDGGTNLAREFASELKARGDRQRDHISTINEESGCRYQENLIANLSRSTEGMSLAVRRYMLREVLPTVLREELRLEELELNEEALERLVHRLS